MMRIASVLPPPAVLYASILMAPACFASGNDCSTFPPLQSPDGEHVLSQTTRLDSEEVEVWVIMITDSDGQVLMSLLGPDCSVEGGIYRAWDDMGRAWIYFEPWQEIMCYGPGPDGWDLIYRNDAGKYEEGFEPPDNLYPPLPGDQTGYRPAMLPELLVEDSGPGWRYSLSCPGIPSDIAFLRDLVEEDMAAMKEEFSSYAEANFDDWGSDPDYMSWTLEAVMSILPAPEGMLAASCSWWDFSGGAHGNTGYRLWRFEHDVCSGGPVPWAGIGTGDILADSTELVALSALVVESLAKTLGENADMGWIVEGAGPSWSNYELLLPVPDSSGTLAGFSIHFPAYSVAPYVAGPQDVFIPIGLLRP
jgi:hypothetical protein